MQKNYHMSKRFNDEDTNTGFIHMFSETHDTVLRSTEQQLEECKMLQQEIMDKLYEVEN